MMNCIQQALAITDGYINGIAGRYGEKADDSCGQAYFTVAMECDIVTAGVWKYTFHNDR